jgi:hypothetical protein
MRWASKVLYDSSLPPAGRRKEGVRRGAHGAVSRGPATAVGPPRSSRERGSGQEAGKSSRLDDHRSGAPGPAVPAGRTPTEAAAKVPSSFGATPRLDGWSGDPRARQGADSTSAGARHGPGGSFGTRHVGGRRSPEAVGRGPGGPRRQGRREAVHSGSRGSWSRSVPACRPNGESCSKRGVGRVPRTPGTRCMSPCGDLEGPFRGGCTRLYAGDRI